jgi:hypothetical protein
LAGWPFIAFAREGLLGIPDYSGKFLAGHSLKRPISGFRFKPPRQRRRYHTQVFMWAILPNLRDYALSVSVEVIGQRI